VDTYRSQIAEICIDEGASMINDISGGTFDRAMIPLIAKKKVPYIIMHIQGTPENMQKSPSYENVVKEVILFFTKQIAMCHKEGVHDIIVDPGFGFGKSLDNNYQLLQKLGWFNFFECPIMVGFSRKSMINKLLGTNPENALNGTTVLNTIALLKGADILRVHDVREAVEAVKLTGKLKSD
jgi:dihydropteroate synthase